MTSVFLLQHLHILAEDNESVKTIGVYASKEDALLAIQRLSQQLGFSLYPDLIDPLTQGYLSGFYLDEYEIGQDHWSEGFLTV